jgi:hypothetical protein
VLWPLLLRGGGLGVIASAARGAWRELEAKLRPFVARRVRSELTTSRNQTRFRRYALTQRGKVGEWIQRTC